MSARETYELTITCDNCDAHRTYRFPRGTDLRGKRIECSNCGVHIYARAVDQLKARSGLSVRSSEQREPWAFLRDFFEIRRPR